MNYIDYDDLNNAKKKILFLLKTKYSDPNTEYVETDDTDADSVFLRIVNALKSSKDLVLELTALLNREKDSTVSTSTQVPRMNKNGLPKTDRSGNTVFDTVTTTQNVEGKLYHRSNGTYTTYYQISIKLQSNLKNMNHELKSIINHIGYVEPENMITYKEVYEEFMKKLLQLLSNNNIKKFANTTNEQVANLNEIYTSITNESKTLNDYNNSITSTYNYKNVNKESKRNPQTLASSGSITNNNNDDDDN
jgi:hypothetical protein